MLQIVNKEKENVADVKRKRALRSDSVHTENEKKALRSDSVNKEKENVAKAKRTRTLRSNSVNNERENAADVKRKRALRSDSVPKEKENVADVQRNRALRSYSAYRKKESVADNKMKELCRSDPVKKRNERLQDQKLRGKENVQMKELKSDNSYVGAQFKESIQQGPSIRPANVMSALKYLKDNNEKYEDVIVNTTWLEQASELDRKLIDACEDNDSDDLEEDNDFDDLEDEENYHCADSKHDTEHVKKGEKSESEDEEDNNMKLRGASSPSVSFLTLNVRF
ncbi:hypothetical protein DPMN_122510 [Dreissena polymorpha]|uniref:Uncharacterized protein n=1 Tax=Dreissena polymorpha TaxID=45954 RepID=A0A9D4JQM4_DREPO|nr:hypothetical protein DPMN_122510 [Dreissena polymorpha]